MVSLIIIWKYHLIKSLEYVKKENCVTSLENTRKKRFSTQCITVDFYKNFNIYYYY